MSETTGLVLGRRYERMAGCDNRPEEHPAFHAKTVKQGKPMKDRRKCKQCAAHKAVARNWEANAKEWRRVAWKYEALFRRMQRLAGHFTEGA